MKDPRRSSLHLRFAALTALMGMPSSCDIAGEGGLDPCSLTWSCHASMRWCAPPLPDGIGGDSCMRLHVALCESDRCHETDIDVDGHRSSDIDTTFFSKLFSTYCPQPQPEDPPVAAAGTCLGALAQFSDWRFEDGTYRLVIIDRRTGDVVVDEVRSITYSVGDKEFAETCRDAWKCRSAAARFYPATPGSKGPLPAIVQDDVGRPTAVGPCAATVSSP